MVERPKKLLDQVRDVLRLKHYAYRTEQTKGDSLRLPRSHSRVLGVISLVFSISTCGLVFRTEIRDYLIFSLQQCRV